MPAVPARPAEACGLAEAQDKIVAVKSPDAAQFAVGEQVIVGVRRSAGAVAVILAYVGAALAVLLAVLVAAVAVLGWSEGRGARRSGSRGRLLLRIMALQA